MLSNNINLDFQKNKDKETEYITKETLAKTIGNIARDVDKNNKKIMKCLAGLIESIETLNNNRIKDMNFILDVMSGGKYDRRTREAYLKYCQEYDKRNKESKNV